MEKSLKKKLIFPLRAGGRKKEKRNYTNKTRKRKGPNAKKKRPEGEKEKALARGGARRGERRRPARGRAGKGERRGRNNSLF
jgi:hypothetical protein